MNGAFFAAFSLLIASPASAEQTSLTEPGPGRVPVVIESIGAPQPVAHVTGQISGIAYGYRGTATIDGVTFENDCVTPCTLYVRPGLFQIITGGSGSAIAQVSTSLMVPPQGLHVRMRAPSAGQRGSGVLLTLGGAGLAIAGGAALIAGAVIAGEASPPPPPSGVPTAFASPAFTSPSNPGSTIEIIGGVVLGVGLAAMIPGIILLARNPSGVESIDEGSTSAPAATWKLEEHLLFAFAPMHRQGALAVGGISF